MNYIFADYIAKGWLIIYMDDLMVHSTNEEYWAHVKLMLQQLQEYKLGVKLEKCMFNTSRAEYLGLIVGKE